VLLPAAKGSRALTTVLYGLAQQAGYRGVDSFKALAGWVGNIKNPMKQLDNITTTLTVHAGDLATDVRQLSVALSQTLTGAMKTAIFAADGGQTAFNNYATALAHNSVMSDTVKQKATTLAAELLAVTGNTKTAHNEFDTMTTAMGVSRQKADALWKSILKVSENEAKVKNKHFTLTGSGKGSYHISESGTTPLTAAGKKSQSQSLLYGATGAYIGTGTTPTADDVLARVSKGELIVPARMVADGAVDHLRGSIPGFASGGVAGTVAALEPFPTKFANALGTAMTKSMETAMTNASALAASAFGIPGAVAASGPAQTIARRLLASMGWSNQWPALDYLWTRESGWNYLADNPSSGAYGIPQSLPASKMAAAGADWRTNPETQIRWGLGYIRATYGGPDNAWAHELSHGWYDQGGILPPGLTLAANKTGGPELVLTPGQLAALGGAGNTYHAHFDGLTGQAIEGHVRTAFTAMQIAEAHHARIGRPQ
jgi:hypothetical protein